MKKTIIISAISLVTGIILVLIGYFVFTVIKTQQKVEQSFMAINQIVNFLNSQIKKETPIQ